MTDDRPIPDALLERLRTRIADPDRRVDHRPSQFQAGIASLDLGQLFGQLRQAGADLDRIVQANQAGRRDPEMNTRAEQIERDVNTPVRAPLPGPASAAALDDAERQLGFPLPASVRQLYGEVADGGFGPGMGLLTIAGAVERYRTVQEETPRNQAWPDRLLPLVDDGSVIDSVDASGGVGRIVSWDPEELSERSSDKAWARSFSELAPSLEAWLDTWLTAPNPQDAMQELMRRSMADAVRQSRAHFASMTPEERATYGLPEADWERQIGGELGLDLDEDA